MYSTATAAQPFQVSKRQPLPANIGVVRSKIHSAALRSSYSGVRYIYHLLLFYVKVSSISLLFLFRPRSKSSTSSKRKMDSRKRVKLTSASGESLRNMCRVGSISNAGLVKLLQDVRAHPELAECIAHHVTQEVRKRYLEVKT